MEIRPKLEKRDIAIILGTSTENLDKLGFDVRDQIQVNAFYPRKIGEPTPGRVELYDAEVGGVPVYLLSRHSSDGEYTPAYEIDHASNILTLVDDEHGAGAKVILASSLVGGCRTTAWEIGDIILVRDGIDMHPDTHYVQGNKPYVHAHNLFDPEVSEILREKAIDLVEHGLGDGGIYYSGPDTTGNRFETPAEMARLLAPAYLRRYLADLAKILGMKPPEYVEHLYKMDKLEPNLVGMTLVREAGYARTLSTRRSDGYQTRFGGFAVISDFPEDEKTDHKTNSDVAFQKLPIIMEVFAEAVPEIERKLRNGEL